METDGLPDNTVANISIEKLDTLVSNSLDIHKSQLDLKLAVMLDNADKNLINLLETVDLKNKPGDETEDESDQNNDYLTKLIRILHSERDNIEKSFFQAVNENTTNPGQSISDEPSLNNKLSLIDQVEMDEMVAVAAMYTNAMNKYGEEVNNLATRFEFLEMSSNRILPKYMFDLRHICESFKTALNQAELSSDYKQLLFKLFDQDVSSCLGDMYRTLNQLFIDAGVLPEVVYKVKNEDSNIHSTGDNGSNHTADSNELRQQTDIPHHDSSDFNQDKNTTGDKSPGLNNELGQLFSRFMSGNSITEGEGVPQSFSTTPPDMDSNLCYSHTDLMNSLTDLQNNLANVDINNVSDIDAEHIKREIIANMGRSKGGAITKTVHTLDQRRIDFVGMIFNAIAEDESISMIIMNLLMLLQIPIIKTAMLDEALFTEKNHPARTTLDLITKAGRGITESTDRVFTELRKIVDKILQDSELDKNSFEKSVAELKALINNEEKISAENEKNEQYEIIKQHARNVVLGEMRLVTKHKTVPENTRPLILKFWPSLMFNRYLDHGMESSEWLSALETFNLLMNYLQPANSRSRWQELNDIHESLTETVRDELYKTRLDREEINTQISALKQTFLAILDTNRHLLEEETESEKPEQGLTPHSGGITNASESANEEHDDSSPDDKAARIAEQLKIAREKISRLPTNICPGVWFEVFNGDDRPVRRLKLSVILSDVAKLIFVDRQGVKVIEKDVDDFLCELDNKKSRFIADHSTFEHALGSVIHKFAA